ncbi:MAG: lambda-exonuclease family protein [Microvirga sp.]
MNVELYFDKKSEWLEARRTLGIGSSDAAAILGISRYKSAFQLFQEKLGVMPASKNETELLEWGNILEEPIAQRYSMETNRRVINPNVTQDGARVFTIIRSQSVDFQIAQVDRFVEKLPDQGENPEEDRDFGVLEIKNAHFFVGKSWLDEQEPPLEFTVQLQHQLAVTGKQWGSIAALIGGCRFVWGDIARDNEFIELLTKAEDEFWERLKRNEAPPPDGSEWTAKTLAKLFPGENGQIIPAPIEAVDWHVELAKAKQQEKDVLATRGQMENRIKAAIGENTGIRLPDGTIYTWKTQRRREFVSKATTFKVLRLTEARKPELPAGTVTPLQLGDMQRDAEECDQ